MLASAEAVADWAHDQGVGDAVAIDHTVKSYRKMETAIEEMADTLASYQGSEVATVSKLTRYAETLLKALEIDA